MSTSDTVPPMSRAHAGTAPDRRRAARPAAGVAPRLAAALCVAFAWACGPGGQPGDAGGASDGGPDPGSDRGGGSEATAGGWRGVVLEDPVPAAGFTLTDTQGRPFRFPDDAPGRVKLLFFGYTHCPDVCPVQMANLGAVLETLRPSVRKEISVVFVSVDPARDTAQRIRAWLDRHGEGFVGLRGPREEVEAVQRRMGLAPAARLPRPGGQADGLSGGGESRGGEDGGAEQAGTGTGDGGAYTVGHASQVLAFTPDGKAHLAYPFGTRQRDWAADLRRLVREGWSPPGRD